MSKHHIHLDDRFIVTIDETPAIHPTALGVAVDVRTDEGLAIVTPIIGPSPALMMRLFCEQPGRQWQLVDAAALVGIGLSVARRCIERMAMFGWLTHHDRAGHTEYQIHPVGAPSARQVERLHPELAARYARLSGQVEGSFR